MATRWKWSPIYKCDFMLPTSHVVTRFQQQHLAFGLEGVCGRMGSQQSESQPGPRSEPIPSLEKGSRIKLWSHSSSSQGSIGHYKDQWPLASTGNIDKSSYMIFTKIRSPLTVLPRLLARRTQSARHLAELSAHGALERRAPREGRGRRLGPLEAPGPNEEMCFGQDLKNRSSAKMRTN